MDNQIWCNNKRSFRLSNNMKVFRSSFFLCFFNFDLWSISCSQKYNTLLFYFSYNLINDYCLATLSLKVSKTTNNYLRISIESKAIFFIGVVLNYLSYSQHWLRFVWTIFHYFIIYCQLAYSNYTFICSYLGFWM